MSKHYIHLMWLFDITCIIRQCFFESDKNKFEYYPTMLIEVL